MTEIEERYLQQLRDKGLFVSKPFSEQHTLAGAVWIAKPSSVSGNSIPEYNGTFGDISIDAPQILFRHIEEGWMVLQQDHVPTLGPGDFRNIWPSAQNAIDDILDFYFGNSTRMNVIAELDAQNRTIKKF